MKTKIFCPKAFLSLSAVLLFVAFARPALAVTGCPDSVGTVRNIILMIPDGTSPSTISMARWYQRYLHPDEKRLAIDPYICGTVLTYSSNAPIGDSAPTTSCYMTGVPSITGFISTYPYSCGKDDLIPLDTTKAFSPLATLLEVGKMRLGKKAGLVFTCEFPHATPADCSAHIYSRKRYDAIIPQMVHQGLDVVIGGGASLLPQSYQRELESRGYDVVINDRKAMHRSASGKLWALYADRDMPYDLDRDTAIYPSLAEATALAIDKLNAEEKGFFLMVEGSKVDWAAHANDPVGMATEYLAFDRACRVALDFARRDGQTAVIVVSDHCNSGISIGKEGLKDYDKQSANSLFGTLTRIRLSADAMAAVVRQTRPDQLDSLFTAICGFLPTDEERIAIHRNREYPYGDSRSSERKDAEGSLYSGSLSTLVSRIYAAHTSIGFTSHGHTGEAVLLAAYHPEGDEPGGFVVNTELADYMARLWGMQAPFDGLTDSIFCPHTELFEGMAYEVQAPRRTLKDLKLQKDYRQVDLSDYHPRLLVRNGRHKTEVIPYRDYVLVDGQRHALGSVVVYQDKNRTFYLPRTLRALLGVANRK